jgi:hypothetical protein
VGCDRPKAPLIKIPAAGSASRPAAGSHLESGGSVTEEDYNGNGERSTAWRLSRGPTKDEDWPEVIPVPPPIANPRKFPQWFNDQITKMYPARWAEVTPDELSPAGLLSEKYGESLHRCFSNWGSAIYAGKEWLILEPHVLTSENLEALIVFTQEFGLGIRIWAGAAHQPCQALRIMIHPRGDWSEDRQQDVTAYS